ncbi:hypothetical protein BS78_03G207500, partial [Paspalum vaginatum]
MPRVLMASTTTEHLASSPAGGPPGPTKSPPPGSSAPPPPNGSTPSSPPPPPLPSPPPKQSPPPPAAPSGHDSPKSPLDESLVDTPPSPPPRSPTASPPPPASPPPSPPATSRSSPPPPPSMPPPSPPPHSSPPPPASPTPPSSSQHPPPASTTNTPPPPSSSENQSSPPPNVTSGSTSKAPPPPPHGTPSSTTPPDTASRPLPSSASPTHVLPPPMAVTVIMPASGSPAGTATARPLGPPPPAGSSVRTEVLIGISVAGLLLALASLFIFVCSDRGRKRRREQASRKHNVVVPERVVSPDVYQPSNGPAPSPSGTNSYDFTGGSKSWFTYDELVGITGGFSAANVIGEGGFGKVYMGALADGRRVAVKQLKVGSGQGEKEFRAEVEIISRIHHRHLVTLVGYCVTENHRLLVYEFVPNDTLEHHLHGRGLASGMDWPKRMRIAIGAARGLTYLHEDCHPRIIHRDIKSANILLDDDFEAKVADFGLAKLTNDALTHISTRVMGTFGYMAPEYASSGKLTDRSDVFSFGVVLLELITGRKPVDASQPLGEESLVEWARVLLVDALDTDDFREVADPALEGRFSKAEMRRMVEAAAACVRHSAAKRPKMVQVWRSLDVDEVSSDLTNGVKLGQSTAYDSGQYSADIELFRRMAFANDLSTAELGAVDDDEDDNQ